MCCGDRMIESGIKTGSNQGSLAKDKKKKVNLD